MLTLNNCTVSSNTASEGSGGGIWNTLKTSILTLNNSTVSGNSATGAIGLGGGIDNLGTLNVSNTIIAGNTKDDLRSALISQGHNLIGNTAGGNGFRPGLGDLLNMDPLLDFLKDNGGLTHTQSLLVGSPAIDQGDMASCLGTDQRGYSRPIDGDRNGIADCDIGAFEFDGTPQTSTLTPEPVATLALTSILVPASVTPELIKTQAPTSRPGSTDTPTLAVTPTSTPIPSPPRCSGVIILLLALALLVHRSKRIFL